MDNTELNYADQEEDQHLTIHKSQHSASTCSSSSNQARCHDDHVPGPHSSDTHLNDMSQPHGSATEVCIHREKDWLQYADVPDPGHLCKLHQLPEDVSMYLPPAAIAQYRANILQMDAKHKAGIKNLDVHLTAKSMRFETRMLREMQALLHRHKQLAAEQNWHLLPEEIRHRLCSTTRAEVQALIHKHTAAKAEFIRWQHKARKQEVAALSKKYDDWRWWYNLKTMKQAGLVSLAAHRPAHFPLKAMPPQHYTGYYHNEATTATDGATADKAFSGVPADGLHAATKCADAAAVNMPHMLGAATNGHTSGEGDGHAFLAALLKGNAHFSPRANQACAPSPAHIDVARADQSNLLQQLVTAVEQQQQVAASLQAVAPAQQVCGGMQQLMMDVAAMMQAAAAPSSMCHDNLLGAPMILPSATSSPHDVFAATSAPYQQQQQQQHAADGLTDESEVVTGVQHLMMQLMM